MRPFSSKTISTGSYTIGSLAKRSTLKSGLIWMLFRDSSGERGGWSAYFLLQPTRKIKAITQYSFRFIICHRCQAGATGHALHWAIVFPSPEYLTALLTTDRLVRSGRRCVGASARLRG